MTFVKIIIIPITITYLPEGYYLAMSDILTGLIAQGSSIDETIEITEDVARHLISIELEGKRELPPKNIRNQRIF